MFHRCVKCILPLSLNDLQLKSLLTKDLAFFRLNSGLTGARGGALFRDFVFSKSADKRGWDKGRLY